MALALFTLSLSMHALAAPLAPTRSCDVSKAVLVLPTNQTKIVRPTSIPSFVTIAFGIQNYTCSEATLTYASAGAVAELYDISCLVSKPAFGTIQDLANKAWNAAPVAITPAAIAASSKKIISGIQSACNPSSVGQHYFVPNPITGTGISPKWDFLASQNRNPQAFVVVSKVDGLAAPTGSKDVDWLSLKGIQGGLASEVFRVDTRDGQPPASCIAGSAPIQVKYTSKYWLYGGSVKK